MSLKIMQPGPVDLDSGSRKTGYFTLASRWAARWTGSRLRVAQYAWWALRSAAGLKVVFMALTSAF